MDTGYLNFCPRCGRQELDREVHGSPGTAMCGTCGTLFAILSVRFGEKMVVIAGGQEMKDAKVATGTGPVPEDPSTETTIPLADDDAEDDPRETTLRIAKKPTDSSSS